ncbi:MAG: sortase [Ardenticatenaceae bacterium]|nr:sortase [Ardenticatenaceae bacterium]
MRDWIPRLTNALITLGVVLIVVGLTMWWRETRAVAVPALPPEIAVGGDAPSVLPAFEEDQVTVTVASPTPTRRPTSTPQASATATHAVEAVAYVATTAPSPPATPTPLPLSPTATPPGVPPAAGPPTRIVAPAIGLDARVVPMGWQTLRDAKGNVYSEWVVPSYAAGWHLNSSLPGHPGNVVLSGHHNIEGEVFRYTVNLNPGDQITLYVGDQPYEYTVVERVILPEKGQPYAVRLKNAQYIAQTTDNRLTLVTCWPYTTNTHRVVVVAHPVEPSQPIAHNN